MAGLYGLADCYDCAWPNVVATISALNIYCLLGRIRPPIGCPPNHSFSSGRTSRTQHKTWSHLRPGKPASSRRHDTSVIKGFQLFCMTAAEAAECSNGG